MNRQWALGLLVLGVLTASSFVGLTLLDITGNHADPSLVDAARGLLAATLLYVGIAHTASSGNGK